MMTLSKMGLLATMCWVLVGCSKAPDKPALVSLEHLRSQTPKTAAEYLAEAPYVEADRKLGARIYLQCVACHSLDADAPAGPGPGLHGLFGRKTAALPRFAYSEALRSADFPWTPLALNNWLARPLELIPGSQMAFAGIYDEGQRIALIAYLLESTEDEEDLSD